MNPTILLAPEICGACTLCWGCSPSCPGPQITVYTVVVNQVHLIPW